MEGIQTGGIKVKKGGKGRNSGAETGKGHNDNKKQVQRQVEEEGRKVKSKEKCIGGNKRLRSRRKKLQEVQRACVACQHPSPR